MNTAMNTAMSRTINPAEIPLALYVHLPWCAKKCPYCDFNSFTATREPPRTRYVDALLRDLDLNRALSGERVLESVFLGGGTPSLFEPADIARILAGIRERFDLAAGAEITMEANPGTVDCGDPAGYREAGINRLSIGAQSFSDAALRRLGRIHTADAIGASFAAAREAGFDNINLDVMFCLPGQDVAAAVADIDAAVALSPEHISWYHLTLEPNTVFHARPPAGLPNEELAADIQIAGAERLVEGGFRQYEVSAWARSGRECRHNLNYWTFGDYLAAGAGAHGKITTAAGIERFERPANPEAYMQLLEQSLEQNLEQSPERREALTSRPVAAGDVIFEFMLNALRLKDGFSLGDFERATGQDRTVLTSTLGRLTEAGLVEAREGGRVLPSERGYDVLNELLAAFLPVSERGQRV